VPGIEPGPLDLWPRTLTTRPQRQSLRDTIGTIKKNTGILIEISKGVGLEINVVETKYMLLSVHQKVGQNHKIKIAGRSF
jgi:hypothetical protein